MPKIKWDEAEEPAINNFYIIDNRQYYVFISYFILYVYTLFLLSNSK